MNWRYVRRSPDAVNYAEAMSDDLPGERNAERASGLVECEICGYQYHDHPPHPVDTYLTVVCSGEVFKL